ncbi:MAG: hypothetical protein JOY79_08125 [Acidobacteriaceae bacterium]|nr:hypothetical protein [Acidobacteriaceae bacterium]
MTFVSAAKSGLVFFIVATTSIACQKEQKQSAPAPSSAPAQSQAAPPPASTPAAPAANPLVASAPTPPPAPGPVLGSGQYTANPDVHADLLEVKRLTGGALILKWRVVNAGAKEANYQFSWDDLYYIDPAENKKYGPLADSEGHRILDVFEGGLKPGDQRMNWAKFPAPPPSSKRISISLPKFPPLEDVPVAD